MELTIDELAQRSGMTGRNIRQWQTYGLLPPPQRRGRVGIYTEDHLARIIRIKELRAQGFPLDLIRRLLESPGMDAEADMRHLAAGAVRKPARSCSSLASSAGPSGPTAAMARPMGEGRITVARQKQKYASRRSWHFSASCHLL